MAVFVWRRFNIPLAKNQVDTTNLFSEFEGVAPLIASSYELAVFVGPRSPRVHVFYFYMCHFAYFFVTLTLDYQGRFPNRSAAPPR